MSTQYQTIRRVVIISKTVEKHKKAMLWCVENYYRIMICGPQIRSFKTTGKYKLIGEKRLK